jgi:hypothetical protein
VPPVFAASADGLSWTCAVSVLPGATSADGAVSLPEQANSDRDNITKKDIAFSHTHER